MPGAALPLPVVRGHLTLATISGKMPIGVKAWLESQVKAADDCAPGRAASLRCALFYAHDGKAGWRLLAHIGVELCNAMEAEEVARAKRYNVAHEGPAEQVVVEREVA